MDLDAGKIKIFKTIEEAKAAGYYVELNEKQSKEMFQLSEQSQVAFIKRKQKLKLIHKSKKLNKQKLKADRKDERNRRRQNRH
jgi:hypothetical protein